VRDVALIDRILHAIRFYLGPVYGTKLTTCFGWQRTLVMPLHVVFMQTYRLGMLFCQHAC